MCKICLYARHIGPGHIIRSHAVVPTIPVPLCPFARMQFVAMLFRPYEICYGAVLPVCNLLQCYSARVQFSAMLFSPDSALVQVAAMLFRSYAICYDNVFPACNCLSSHTAPHVPACRKWAAAAMKLRVYMFEDRNSGNFALQAGDHHTTYPIWNGLCAVFVPANLGVGVAIVPSLFLAELALRWPHPSGKPPAVNLR
ncbi:hypothetical protein B0H13DRAFT_1883471 [Mycena leptocephala]|nr:hypothetical protein B0H13DRAFT_1883471 [Mycena leptocephala]